MSINRTTPEEQAFWQRYADNAARETYEKARREDPWQEMPPLSPGELLPTAHPASTPAVPATDPR